MSLNKSILYKKEKRKQYKDSRSFDTTCRNHNSCSYCRDNRLYQYNKEKERIEQELEDYEQEGNY